MLFVCLSFWKLYFKALCSLEKYTYRLEGIDKRLKKSWTSLFFFVVLWWRSPCFIWILWAKVMFMVWEIWLQDVRYRKTWVIILLTLETHWWLKITGFRNGRMPLSRWTLKRGRASERVAGLSVGRIHQLLKDRISFICCKFSCGF